MRKKEEPFGSRFSYRRRHRNLSLEWHLHSSVSSVSRSPRSSSVCLSVALKRNSGAVLWWAYLLYLQIPLSPPPDNVHGLHILALFTYFLIMRYICTFALFAPLHLRRKRATEFYLGCGRPTSPEQQASDQKICQI